MDFYEKMQKETTSVREALYAVPLAIDSAYGRVSKDTYLAYLEQAYHHVKNALPLMLAMASRIPPEKEWLRRTMVEYLSEEIGHDEWILNDIRAAGGDAEKVRNSTPCMAVELMNAYNYDIVMRGNPVGYFGMIVALESSSVDLATGAAESMMKTMGLGKECFSYLLSHGTLDIEHTQFIANVLRKITDVEDQKVILHATKIIYQLYADMLRSIPHTPQAAQAA